MPILRSDIPEPALASIDSLCVWALTAIEEMYDNQNLIQEDESVFSRVISISEYKDLDECYRLSSRVQFRLASNYKSTPHPIWKDVIPIASIALPPAFKASILDPIPAPTPTPDPIPAPTPDPILIIDGIAWNSIFEDGFYTVTRPSSVVGAAYSITLIDKIRLALFQKYDINPTYDSYFVNDDLIFYYFNLP